MKRILIAVLIGCLLGVTGPPAPLGAQQQIKVSVFNFGALNIEACGYGTSVTNMLINTLAADPLLAIMDRKDLENFLTFNDLQQNDKLDNVVLIGSKLGLNIIVVGTVEKRGTVIHIKSNVIQIERKRSIHHARVAALGDAGLTQEVQKLGGEIQKAIRDHLLKRDEGETGDLKSPERIEKRSGNRRVSLSWDAPEKSVTGYEIFRSLDAKGPYVKIARITATEYLDEGLEKNTTYYYKVRSFDNRGQVSAYSRVIAAETALTPNPPVILSTESHIKSIALTWAPGPQASDDPLKLKGYKLYRAKVEAGPYREIANILGADLGLGLDETLDKLFKVPYQDKGLADGEDYFYRVTAYNEKGLESDFSRPMKGTAIPIVTGLKAKGDMVRQIDLSWNASDQFYVKGYYVYRSTTPDGNFIKIKRVEPQAGPDKRIEYSDTEGLGDKVRYYYRVTAFEDADLETSPSLPVFATTIGKPPTPEDFRAAGGLVKKVELTWKPSPAPEVEGYNLYWSRDTEGRFVLLKRLRGREVNRYTDDYRGMTKIGDGETYSYTITAFNRADVESETAKTVRATTKKRPQAPTGLKGEVQPDGRVVLTWQAGPEPDLAGYTVYEQAYLNPEPVAERLTAPVYRDERPLKAGQERTYLIRARDRDGLESDFSTALKVRR